VGMNRAAQPDHAEQPVRGALGHGRACERLLSGTQCLRRDQYNERKFVRQLAPGS
jgi:hypothetical protein